MTRLYAHEEYLIWFTCSQGCKFRHHRNPHNLLSEMVAEYADSRPKTCPVCGHGKTKFLKITQGEEIVWEE